MQAVGPKAVSRIWYEVQTLSVKHHGIPNHVPFLPCGYVVTCGRPCRIMAITLILGSFCNVMDCSEACERVGMEGSSGVGNGGTQASHSSLEHVHFWLWWH